MQTFSNPHLKLLSFQKYIMAINIYSIRKNVHLIVHINIIVILIPDIKKLLQS